MTVRGFASIAALLISAAAGSAGAQTALPESSLSATDLDPFDLTPSGTDALAASEFSRGATLFHSGRPREAAEAFDHSFRLRPRANTLYNAAQAYRSAGAYVLAIDTFERYLLDATLPPARRDATEATVSDLRRSLAVLTLRPLPSSSLISVDGASVTPGAPLRVDPGTHIVSARASGFAPSALRFTVRPEEQRTVSLALERSSVFSRWWFWTGVGASVTVAAVAFTTILLVTTHESPVCGTLSVCVGR